MALSVAALLSWQSTTDATSFTTASATPTANRLYLAWVETSHATAAPTPTASGWGLTWTQVATVHLADLGSGSARRITLFSASGSGSSGTVAFSFGGVTATGCLGHIHEWTGATIPYIQQFITKSLTAGGYTSASTTLTQAVQSTGTTTAVVGMVEKDAVLAFTVGTGFTSAYDNGYSTPATRALVEYDIGPTDGVLDCTWAATASGWTAIAVELGESKALMGTLTDAFTTIGAAWNDWGGANTNIVSNELNISSTVSSTNYYGIDTTAQYDLTGSVASIKVVNQGNQALTSWEAYPVFMYLDATNDISWLITGGSLGARKTIAGSSTAQGSTVTYSLVTHKYLRIRESAGTVYWDYSADGSSWTNQTSIAVSSLFPVTCLRGQVLVGTYASEASATTLKVDDWNILINTIQATGSWAGDGAYAGTATWTANATGSYAGAGAYAGTATRTTGATGSFAGAGAYAATGVRKAVATGSYAGAGAYAANAVVVNLHAVPEAKVYIETTAGVWVDVTADFQQGYTKRGRQAELDKYTTGTASLQFINSNRKYDPTYAAGPLYGYLDLRHRMKIEAVHGITTYPIFLGYIDSISENRVLRDNAVITTIRLSDYFKVLNKYTIDGTSFSSQLVGARITAVLDIVDATSSRNIDAGVTTLQSGTYSSTLLSHAQTAAITEFGDFFIQANGVIRFKSRDSSLSEPLHGTFGDGIGEHHYKALTPQFDDSYIRNPVTVDRNGGTAQTASDSALYAPPPAGYGRNHFTLSGTYHNSDANALSAAQYILARFKLPKRRVIGIEVGPVPYEEGPLTYPEILARELTQRIMINERPMGIDPIIQQASVIEGIEHSFSPKTWTTKFNVSPGFGDGAFWVLGVSHLGTETVLYF